MLGGEMRSDHLAPLLQSLSSLSDQISSILPLPVFFLRRHSLSLLRKTQILRLLFDTLLHNSSSWYPWLTPPSSSAALCLNELLEILTKTLNVVRFCGKCSRIYLLIQIPQLSLHFHDLNHEIATVFDVIPMEGVEKEVKEHLVLFRRHSDLPVNSRGDALRREVLKAMDLIKHGEAPEEESLRGVFAELGFEDGEELDSELESLNEMMKADDQTSSGEGVINFSDLYCFVRYAKLALFGLEKGAGASQDELDGFGEKEELEIPEDFRCPISLELMSDPVTVSTGQTYDRSSISRWLESGHVNCPKSGQLLTTTELIPNLALRGVISRWCAANSISYEESPELAANPGYQTTTSLDSTVSFHATRLTSHLLIKQLEEGSAFARTRAACELRLLARSGSSAIRATIVSAGGIRLLVPLLSCGDGVAEENSVTAILNLSLYEPNKEVIIATSGCLPGIVHVLRLGSTVASRENAAAALFSLSSTQDLKRQIAREPGVIEGLVELLLHGPSARSRRDALSALFTMSSCKDNIPRIVESGGVEAALESLRAAEGGVVEEAAGVMALLTRHSSGVAALAAAPGGVAALAWVLRSGSAKAKEHAVAALLEICKHGGPEAMDRVQRTPLLAKSLQAVLICGTSRAKRKAQSLARICSYGGPYGHAAAVSGNSMPVSLTAVSVPFR